MEIIETYKRKLLSADEAASRVTSGCKLGIAMAAAEPPALLAAIARRAERGELKDVRAYYYESTPVLADTILRYELNERIRPYCMFLSAAERALIKRGAADGRKVVDYVPSTFHQAPRLLSEHIGIDTFVSTVSPIDEHGYFSLGTGNDYSSRVARTARQVIVEVNEHMPRVQGAGAQLHVSEVTAILENHIPLFELPVRAAAPEDEKIGRTIADMVPDGACLQMGVGGLPDFVCAQLTKRNDLGIHTEALCPGMIDLMKLGVVNNRRKTLDTGKTVFTFALGQKAMYDFIHENPGIYSHPVDYVNAPAIIARNDRVISICATLQIDLTGACNSEHMLGHQYTASGGQLDFVRGAYASKEGKSIIACRSTAAKGKVSRIVARLDGPVTSPRIDTHIVATEHGWVDLKGKSSPERAQALIGLADPQFRDELLHQAKQLNLL
jgi:itaconate CoA-transferase